MGNDNQEVITVNLEKGWGKFVFFFVSGLVLGFMGCMIAVESLVVITQFTAKDANLVLSRDQVVSMARTENGCRYFVSFYDETHDLNVASSATFADEDYGGTYQNTSFTSTSADEGDVYEDGWDVTVTTQYLSSSLFPNIFFTKRSSVACSHISN